MSSGVKYDYAPTLEKARELVSLIEPFCYRIQIAGSLRRRKRQVRDIDLVVIWKAAGLGLAGVWQQNKARMTIPKGGSKIIRFTWEFVPVQISVATEEAWPMILLIRTGSANFNKFLATLALRRGMKLKASGYLIGKDLNEIDLECEQDIFAALGLKFREPQQRENP
jgi:DNA polymerase (family 10)